MSDNNNVNIYNEIENDIHKVIIKKNKRTRKNIRDTEIKKKSVPAVKIEKIEK